MARSGGAEEVEGIDEEFLFHLGRGSELLVRGDAEPARASLERAMELRPKDGKVLGLLGQAYYKLSRYEDAAKVWQRLVDDNPVEPTARVNLGLALLKAKRHPEAVKQLEIALDLNPEHKKAMGYLGLALLESGNLTRARDWFRKAGSEQMVARCDDLIAGRGTASPQPRLNGAASASRAEAEEGAAAPEEPTLTPAPEPMRTPAPVEVAYRPVEASTVLQAWAGARLVNAVSAETFRLSEGSLVVSVRGEIHIRLDGLFATQGQVAFAAETKRFRGKDIEKPFGEGATRMHRASGEGVLLYRTQGRRFSALDLAPDAAYLREEVLFGFEDGLAYENGRVPSSISAELNLVHLRGRGRFLLVTAGEPVTIDVTKAAPLRVPIDALIGWIGGLTPRVCALLEDAGAPAVVAVELTGDGRVIADPAAGLGLGG